MAEDPFARTERGAPVFDADGKLVDESAPPEILPPKQREVHGPAWAGTLPPSQPQQPQAAVPPPASPEQPQAAAQYVAPYEHIDQAQTQREWVRNEAIPAPKTAPAPPQQTDLTLKIALAIVVVAIVLIVVGLIVGVVVTFGGEPSSSLSALLSSARA